MRILDAIGLALWASALSGCGAAAPASRFPTADDAIGRMKATYACTNGVQGTAKIDHFSPQGRIRGDLYLFAVNPDRVRFDVVSPFGATLYTLTSDGDRFEMLDVKEKRFLHGPSSPCNLARLTQVPVPAHALVALLRGEAPVLVHKPAGAQISWEKDGFYKLLVQSTRDASQEIHLEIRPEDLQKPWQEQRIRVTDVRVSQRGADLYHAELKNHQAAKTAEPRTDPDGIDEPVPPSGPACDAELPRSIRMRVPNTEQDVIFQYKEAKWNPPILPGAFEQPVPGGVRKVFVTCEK
jgi:outer membrane lipoprotein-sorting protein